MSTTANSKDLYTILGVKETAGADEIKKAYRELAKKNHPDRTGGDKTKEARFKEVSAAYEVLSDPTRRKKYDAMRRGGFRPGAPGQPMDFSGFEGISGLDDLFGQIFGGAFTGFGGAGGGARRPAPGGRGGSRVVFESSPFDGFAQQQQARPPAAPVPEVVRTRDGDFVRLGDDLTYELELGIDEAVLGAKLAVPTIHGRVTMAIPPGTSSGQKLRLRGKGMRRADGTHGDQFVAIKILVPADPDDRAKELIKEFAARAPVRPRR